MKIIFSTMNISMQNEISISNRVKLVLIEVKVKSLQEIELISKVEV